VPRLKLVPQLCPGSEIFLAPPLGRKVEVMCLRPVESNVRLCNTEGDRGLTYIQTDMIHPLHGDVNLQLGQSVNGSGPQFCGQNVISPSMSQDALMTKIHQYILEISYKYVSDA